MHNTTQTHRTSQCKTPKPNWCFAIFRFIIALIMLFVCVCDLISAMTITNACAANDRFIASVVGVTRYTAMQKCDGSMTTKMLFNLMRSGWAHLIGRRWCVWFLIGAAVDTITYMYGINVRAHANANRAAIENIFIMRRFLLLLLLFYSSLRFHFHSFLLFIFDFFYSNRRTGLIA